MNHAQYLGSSLLRMQEQITFLRVGVTHRLNCPPAAERLNSLGFLGATLSKLEKEREATTAEVYTATLKAAGVTLGTIAY